MYKVKPILGSTGGQGFLGQLIDHQETYGPHIIRQFLNIAFPEGSSKRIYITDLGAGSGRDLQICKDYFKHQAVTYAVENSDKNIRLLNGQVDHILNVDIEKTALPFANESLDIVIANQVLEHTKEIFWIFHEVTRSLKVGGYFIFGVPNIASLHNRFLLLLGFQPTQHKLCSAHVRPFSKLDTIKFLNICFPSGYCLKSFAGSQFYPLPAKLARIACRMFPNLSFSIFFMVKKIKKYDRSFLDHPINAQLETSFFLG